MKAYLEIENSHTQDVETYECPVLKFDETGEIKFDISSLTDKQLKNLMLAISEEPNQNYIDIEMFFINNDEVPYFGPDYDFKIKNSILIGKYNRKIYPRKER